MAKIMSSAEQSGICSGMESTPVQKDLIGAGAVKVIPELGLPAVELGKTAFEEETVKWAEWGDMSEDEKQAAWDNMSNRQQTAALAIVDWIESQIVQKKSNALQNEDDDYLLCSGCGGYFGCSCGEPEGEPWVDNSDDECPFGYESEDDDGRDSYTTTDSIGRSIRRFY
jgi:hypothetical protein